MSRLSRLPVIAFGWYYIELQAESGRRVVTSAADIASFLRVLTATLKQQGAQLHAGYVGESGVHLALQAGETSVGRITGALCRGYALRFNRTHAQRGPLFKAHAHVLLVQHQAWLIRLVHFVHGPKEGRVSDSGEIGVWWSSDSVYRQRTRMGGLVTGVVLRALAKGSHSRRTQNEAYARVFSATPDAQDAHRFLNGSPLDPRMLGDDDFLANIWRLTDRPPPELRRMSAQGDDQLRLALTEWLGRFHTLYETLPHTASGWLLPATLASLCSRSRRRPLPMLRALCASYLLEHRLVTQRHLARVFGCRPATLSLGKRQHHERAFRRLFKQSHEGLFPQRRLDL